MKTYLDGRYFENSPVIAFGSNLNILYFGVFYGAFIFLHSSYIHKRRYHSLRVITELSAIALSVSCGLYLYCELAQPPLADTARIRNWVGNAFLGGYIQGADNYLTFSRYNVVCGGTSTVHKYLALTYVIVFLYLSWFPFFTFLPVFGNMNSPFWLYVQLITASWINFVTYLVYDVFYVLLLAVEIYKHRHVAVHASRNTAQTNLDILGIKAMAHTVLSIAGIFFYSFNLPMGIVEQTVLILTGIHFFLNWQNSHKAFANITRLATVVFQHPSSYISRFSSSGIKIGPSSAPNQYTTTADGHGYGGGASAFGRGLFMSGASAAAYSEMQASCAHDLLAAGGGGGGADVEFTPLEKIAENDIEKGGDGQLDPNTEANLTPRSPFDA